MYDFMAWCTCAVLTSSANEIKPYNLNTSCTHKVPISDHFCLHSLPANTISLTNLWVWMQYQPNLQFTVIFHTRLGPSSHIYLWCRKGPHISSHGRHSSCNFGSNIDVVTLTVCCHVTATINMANIFHGYKIQYYLFWIDESSLISESP